jgi:hypothetical protein
MQSAVEQATAHSRIGDRGAAKVLGGTEVRWARWWDSRQYVADSIQVYLAVLFCSRSA